MVFVVSWAAAADLVPLDRYDPKPVQVGLSVSLSGKRVSWSLDHDGVREIQVAPIDALARAETVLRVTDAATSLWSRWTADDDVLLVTRAAAGRTTLQALNVATGVSTELATAPRVQVFGFQPGRASIGVYRRGPSEAPRSTVGPSADPAVAEEVTVYAGTDGAPELDVRTVDLETGAWTSTWQGRPFPWIMVDRDLRPTLGAQFYTAGVRFDGEWIRQPTVETLHRLGPRGRARRLYGLWDYGGPAWVNSLRERSTYVVERRDGVSALVAVDLATGDDRVVLESMGPDIVDAWVAANGDVLTVAVEEERVRWWSALPWVTSTVRALEPYGDITGIQIRRDDRVFAWVEGPTEPGGLWLVDPDGARRIGPSYGAWDEVAWRPTEALRLTARDGLPLTAYLTRPDEVVAGPAPWPLVLTVHGGPWGTRDDYRWNPETQRFADLGYAVLAVNFRGSDGFGDAFVEASEGQWGLAMQDDLLDGVAWAVERGVADPARIAIAGASYGGYATLQAMTTAPDVFACGVANAAPGILYGPDRPSVLDESDPRDMHVGSRAVRIAASPITHVARLRRPLLVTHGERDQQVPIEAVEGFVRAAEAGGAPITFVRYPRGRHGPEHEEDAAAQSVLVARFLSGCLGGRAEEWSALPAEAELKVEVGAERIAGLTEALGSRG